MKAMILAAGRGERMRPLTDHCPKPLLQVHEKPLIVHHIERLRSVGFTDFVINLHHLGTQIRAHLGDGSPLGVKIEYSEEAPQALETGGGIVNALPLLGDAPFFVINADIWTDYMPLEPSWQPDMLAHLILTRNPPHNPDGDFGLDSNTRITNNHLNKHTFTGMAWYQPAIFAGKNASRFPLAPLLRDAAGRGLVTGEVHDGVWMDIGTPERLREISDAEHH